ncbi:MAG: hypothetical protein KBT09_06755 [Bacteroidales bacterium]|nr:hypothetical protein [Candidatus Sodaliphilus fimicaballi]
MQQLKHLRQRSLLDENFESVSLRYLQLTANIVPRFLLWHNINQVSPGARETAKHVMRTNFLKEQNEQFGKGFLEIYLNRGFGSMNKNDFEVLIFSLLRKMNGNENKSNYDWCLELRIPETKVKKLAYEADLAYTQYNEVDLRTKFFNLLANHLVFTKDGKNIKFVIEDRTLRTMLSADLKRIGHFADNSFNSEIVSVSFEALSALLEEYYQKENSNIILEKCKKEIPKIENGISFQQLFTKFLYGLAQGTGESIPKFLSSVACSYSNPLSIVPSIVKILTSK